MVSAEIRFVFKLNHNQVSLVKCRILTLVGRLGHRKTLYQRVYEYDVPLFHLGVCKYEFVSPEESEYDNAWKESFKQLYHGVHVRPGYQDKVRLDPF